MEEAQELQNGKEQEKISGKLLPKLAGSSSSAWSLDSELELFLQNLINKKTLNEDIETHSKIPLPDNIGTKKSLDNFYRNKLKERNFSKTLSTDEGLCSVQGHMEAAMGPLTKSWAAVQELYGMLFPSEGEETTQERMEDIAVMRELLETMNSAVVLAGNAIHKLAHQRRLAVLSAFSDGREAKQRLKEFQTEIELDNKELFGENFREKIKVEAKEKESLDKAHEQKRKRKYSGPMFQNRNPKMPFRGMPERQATQNTGPLYGAGLQGPHNRPQNNQRKGPACPGFCGR